MTDMIAAALSDSYSATEGGGNMTVHVGAVALAITERTGQLSAMKLQKLCFYAQAWHAYFVDEPLIEQDFEAWINGPVSPTLFDLHRGRYTVSSTDFEMFRRVSLPDSAVAVVDQVLAAYNQFSGDDLSRLTHSEQPWIEARGDADRYASSNQPIRLETMVAQCEEHMLQLAGNIDGSSED